MLAQGLQEEEVRNLCWTQEQSAFPESSLDTSTLNLRLQARKGRRGMSFRSWPLNESVGRELEYLSPQNPFATITYAKAMQALGWQAWILGECGDLLQTGCLAFLRRGRLNTALEIPSFPRLKDPPAFVEGLRAFCRGSGVTRLQINTFASPPVTIPTISGDEVRTPRQEFSIDLRYDLSGGLRVNHRRNIKKAVQAGVQVEMRNNLDACVEHVRLVSSSIERRIQRGEDIQGGREDSYLQTARALIEYGAGFLAQAVLSERILSSILILRSASGAYYQSAGTSPEGMEKGASQFLIYEMLLRTKADSCSVFNLGGASPGTGLALFKVGFGSRPLTLERCNVNVGGSVRKCLRAVIQLLRVRRATLA